MKNPVLTGDPIPLPKYIAKDYASIGYNLKKMRIPFKRFNGELKKGSYMELRKIGSYIILACFLLAFMPITVSAANDNTPAPAIVLPNLLQEKSKMQYGWKDFQLDGEKAREAGRFEEAIKNYNKAEELVRAQEMVHFGQPDRGILESHVSELEGNKETVYRSWPGHEAEAHVAEVNKENLFQESESLKEGAGRGGLTSCLIVTATYGSPLASEVQLVRSFRDDSLKQSYSGSRFIPGFNAWYYSFSPQVSTYINDHPFTKPAMQVILAPFLGIVRLTQMGYSILAFNPELATVSALIIGPSMFACIYIFPFVLAAMWLAQRRGWKGWNIQHMKSVAGVWAAIAVLLVLGVLLSVDLLTTLASGLFVVATIILVAGGLSVSLLQYAHTPKIS